MLARRTAKTHAELDFAAAAKKFSARVNQEPLRGELVTSAWDLYSVETLRDKHNLRVGNGVATDIFVFGKGEPDNPSCTKVGGRPFWPAKQDWPAAIDDSPLPFLAQFNFTDSKDIVGEDLPGDVLLILTELKDEWLPGEDGLSFHWVSADSAPNTSLDVPSEIEPVGPFFGVVHRSVDYPDAEEAAFQLDVEVRKSWNLPILNGTKIGGCPHFIQGGVTTSDTFLCQLGSIQAAPCVPYPWVNQRDPLTIEFDSTGIYRDSVVFGDMGCIYLFIDKSGTVWHWFECY